MPHPFVGRRPVHRVFIVRVMLGRTVGTVRGPLFFSGHGGGRGRQRPRRGGAGGHAAGVDGGVAARHAPRPPARGRASPPPAARGRSATHEQTIVRLGRLTRNLAKGHLIMAGPSMTVISVGLPVGFGRRGLLFGQNRHVGKLACTLLGYSLIIWLDPGAKATKTSSFKVLYSSSIA